MPGLRMEAIRLAPSTPVWPSWVQAGPQGTCRAAKRVDSLVSPGTLGVRCPSCRAWMACFPCLGNSKSHRSPIRAQAVRSVLQAGSSPVCFVMTRGASHLQQGSHVLITHAPKVVPGQAPLRLCLFCVSCVVAVGELHPLCIHTGVLWEVMPRSSANV